MTRCMAFEKFSMLICLFLSLNHFVVLAVEDRCGPVCANITQPFCGTDGNSYENQCEMLKAACRNQKPIIPAYEGTCKTSCDEIQCTYKEDFYCASDVQTYVNPCLYSLFKCQNSNSTVRIEYKGRCRESKTARISYLTKVGIGILAIFIVAFGATIGGMMLWRSYYESHPTTTSEYRYLAVDDTDSDFDDGSDEDFDNFVTEMNVYAVH